MGWIGMIKRVKMKAKCIADVFDKDVKTDQNLNAYSLIQKDVDIKTLFLPIL